MNEDWITSDWFKEWLELAKRDYHGKRDYPPLYHDTTWEPKNFTNKIVSKESK